MSGALLLGIVSLVAFADIVIAQRFRVLADRADTALGARPVPGTDPRALRRAAGVLFISAPIMWVAAALLSFGIIPIDGIIPISVGAGWEPAA